ncbi:hypothetical protein B0J18DRAFT_66654 [Chaetomium sp. MPI-SDFR-AT-0129]|nr:hypothetical protein B0J18DRAFT_66654 [Chaetomium sp. MPI-SDFR-AT-0129]
MAQLASKMATERPESAPLRMIFERRKRSCGECRRRKQKCDQRQPCRNCLRRTPQPECRYQTTPRRGRIASDEDGEVEKDIHDKSREIYDFSDATLSPDPAELLSFDDLLPMPNTPGTRYSYDGYTNSYLDWTIPKEERPPNPTEIGEGSLLSFWPEHQNGPSHSM